MMNTRSVVSTFAAVIVTATATAGALAGTPQSSPSRSTTPYLNPSRVSSTCTGDAARRSACRVVERFFRAAVTRHYASACSLLGDALKTQTYGLSCPRFLAAGMPTPMPWGILRARRSGSTVEVLVELGVSELGHVRMLRHLATVGSEHGALRILETRIV